jgi:2-methylcitrate dehydratase PrpD
VLLRPAQAQPAAAAMINATAAHAFAMDDVAAGCHPSTLLMPALFACAEAQGASGAAVLRAYVAGYEVLAELAAREPDSLHATGWHPTGLLGPVAVAAAVANLARLPAAQCSHAMGIAASMSGGLQGNFGTQTKALHAGRASSAGVSAARLAAAGVTAAADILEAPKGLLRTISPAGRVRTDGPIGCSATNLRVVSDGLSIKKYPICYTTHRIIDAALTIAATPGFDAARARHTEVSIGARQAAMARHHRPKNALEAKYSVEFAVAGALAAGAAGFAQLQDDFIASAKVQRLMAATHIDLREDISADDPVFAPADRVVVRMDDGTSIDSGEVPYARGHARLPVGMAEVRRKFVDCARHGGIANAEALFDLLGNLAAVVDLRALAIRPVP